MKTEKSDTEKYMVPTKGTFDFNDVPLDDPRVWALLSSGRTKGVFQLESRLGQDWARKLQPQNIEELSALIALIRPACLNTGIAESFVKRKFGEETPDQINETLDNIIKDTHGLIVFQEQIIRIAQECAGMTEEEADSKVRKGIAKKKTEVVAEAKKFFKEKASTFGVLSDEQIEYILDYMTKASRYCIVGNTQILTNKGLVKAKKLFQNQGKEDYYAYSMTKDGMIEQNKIHYISDEGIDYVFTIQLKNGRSITTTATHKFPTPHGELRYMDLNTGDELYIDDNLSVGTSTIVKMERRGMDRVYNISMTPPNHNYIANGIITSNSFNKCLTSDAVLTTTDGIRYIKDIKPGMKVKNHRGEYIEVKDVINNGVRNVIQVTTECGRSIKCTTNHKFMTSGYEVAPISNIIENGHGLYTEYEDWYKYRKIVNVLPLGQMDTWNIEIDSQDHLYIANGFVTQNSHSVGYAEEAYSCAYIKTHFPLKFFCSWLSFSDWKPKPKEEMYELVQDAKLFGITVSTPCIHQKNENFKIDKTRSNTIMFGLKHIRGVGAAAIKTITKLDKRIESWPRLLSAIEQLKKNILEALVKSGACDKFGLPRIRMLRDIHVVKGYSDKDSDAHPVTKSLTSKELAYVLPKLANGMELADALKDMLENNGCQSNRRGVIEGKIKYISENRKDTNNQNAAWEKIYLGLNLSCSLVDGVNKTTGDISISCRELFFKEASQKDINVVYASLDKVVTRVTSQKAKNPGKEYAILDISDGTGGLTGIMCWPKMYEEIKEELAEDKVAALYIKKNIWGGRIQYIVEKAEILG